MASKYIITSAVPIFFMISGSLLLSPSYHFNFKKNFLRLAFPLVIWSTLGALFVNNYDISFNLLKALTILPFHESWPHSGHFWYLYALMGFYFIMNILKKMTNNLEQKDYKYILAIWLIFTVLSPSVSFYIPSLNLNGYRINLLIGHIGYLFLGYYLDKYINTDKLFINNRLTAILLLVGLILSLLVAWVLTWYHNLHATKIVDIYLNNFNIFVVIQAVLFFLLAKHFFNHPSKVMVSLGKLSFIAYCCHILVRNFLYYSPLFKSILTYFQSINHTTGVLFQFVFVAFFSYLIAYLLSLLPRKISYYFGI